MKINKLFTLLFLSTLFLFVSCNQLFDSVSEKEETTMSTNSSADRTGNVQITLALPKDLSIDSFNSDDELRSAVADCSGLYYIATATKDSTIKTTQPTISNTIALSDLSTGSWSVNVKAYKTDVASGCTNETLVLNGSKSITVTSGMLKETIILSMTTENTAKGSINLSLAADSSSFNKYSYSFTNKSGNSYYTGTTSTETGGALVAVANATLSNGSSTISVNEVLPGTYGLTILFYKDSSLVYTLNTDISVYPTLTTSVWMLEGGVTESSGNTTFTLTSAMIAAQQCSTLYVCGSSAQHVYGVTGGIATYKDANDSNSGGAYAPLATVGAAVAKCTSTSTSYTIYVDGTTTETAAITLGASTTVSIKSLSTSGAMIQRGFTTEYSVISIPSDSMLTMTNITLDGNKSGPSYSFPEFGGGIINCGKLTLTGCVINNCQANSYGGGIYIRGYAYCIIDSSTISGNSAGNGGGIYSVGDLTITNNSVIGDTTATTATSSACSNYALYNGGGVYVEGGKFTMESSTIARNYASGNGGGVYVEGGAVTMESSTIARNCATNGAGIYYIRSSTKQALIKDSFIQYNYATYNGGGIYIGDGEIKLTNTLIGKKVNGLVDTTLVTSGEAATSDSCSNKANNGGGMYIYGSSTEVTMTESSAIAYNYSTASGDDNSGGGIYLSNGTLNLGTETDYSPQIYANTAAGRGGAIVVSADSAIFNLYGKIHHNYSANYSGGLALETGTINMYAGSYICGNHSGTNYGGGVHIAGGSFNLKGGTISNNSSYGVHTTSGSFNISGAPVLSDDVYLASGKTITVAGTLTNTNRIAVKTANVPVANNPVVIATGYETNNASTAPTAFFTSTDGYYISKDGSGNVTLNSYNVIQSDISVLTLSVDKTTISTANVASNRTITVTATDSSGNSITSNITWLIKMYNHGDETEESSTTNSIVIPETFPTDTYQLVITATYEGTANSATFDIVVTD